MYKNFKNKYEQNNKIQSRFILCIPLKHCVKVLLTFIISLFLPFSHQIFACKLFLQPFPENKIDTAHTKPLEMYKLWYLSPDNDHKEK